MKSKVITHRSMIRSVAERWRSQYYLGGWGVVRGVGRSEKHVSSKLCYDKLLAMNLSKATKEEVDKVIGNESWTEIKCSHCEKPVSKAMRFEIAKNNQLINLCADCLTDMSSALQLQ